MAAVLAGVTILVVVAVLGAVLLTRGEPTLATGTTLGRPTTSTRATTTSESTTSTKPAKLWTPWSPADKSFTIDFPGTPQVSTESGSGTFKSVTMAHTDTGSSGYFVAFYEVAQPRALGDSASFLNAFLDQFADGRMTFASRTPGHWDGKPSLEFVGSATNQTPTRPAALAAQPQYHLQGMAMIAGKRVYLLIAAHDDDHEADFEHFRESLRLKG